MSKKTLKRSLALGALMAFVITGSAYAADADTVNENVFTSVSKSVTDLSARYGLKQTSADTGKQAIANAITVNYIVDRSEFTETNGTNNSTKALGQGYQTGGADLTFDNAVTLVHETNSIRNTTGNATAFGVDIYTGKWTFNGLTNVTVTSTGKEDSEGNNSAISAAGMRVWAYDSDASIILNNETKINVTSYDASKGAFYDKDPKDGENDNELKDLPGTVTGIAALANQGHNGVFAANKKIDITVKSLGGKDTNDGATVYAIDGAAGKVLLNGETNIVAEAEHGKAYGLFASERAYTVTTDEVIHDSNVVIAGNADIDVTASDAAFGIRTENKAVVGLTGTTIDIDVTSANSYARGINAVGKSGGYEKTIEGSVVNLGGESTESINVNVTSVDATNDYGILAQYNGSAVNIKADEFNVTVIGGGNGIGAMNQTVTDQSVSVEKGYDNNPENNAKVVIDGNTITTINVYDNATDMNPAGNAISVMSMGRVDVKGDLYATAKNVVLTRGDSIVKINADEEGESLGKEVVLNGDVAFDYDEKTSGTGVDSDVDIVLSGSESVWSGNTKVAWDKFNNSTNIDPAKLEVDNFTLTLADKAQWNPTVIETETNVKAYKDDDGKLHDTGVNYTALNNLVINDGIINMPVMPENSEDPVIAIEKVTGTGGVINVQGITFDTDNDGEKFALAQIEIVEIADETKLTINGSGAIADQIASGEVTVQDLADTVAKVEPDPDADNTTLYTPVADVITTEEGLVAGAITAEVDEEGMVVADSVKQAVNQKAAKVSKAAANLKAHYRAHMNDMNKRMGELRMANGEAGVWTRMVRGETEYEGAKMQYNQYQLGYDEKLSVDKRWTVGAAVTFAEGDGSYGQGTTDDKSTAFAIYGSKLNNDGTFVDLIARYAHLESDMDDSRYGAGDYSTNGMSVSAEFGKRIQQGNGLWIEPQVELTYGSVEDANVKLSNGVNANFGSMDSFIARAGFALGKDIKQGNVYARASYLYDFDGESTTVIGSGTTPIEEDFGGGWWEVGVGANINLSKATYIYADVEKTFGGEVDTNWQWNLGVRYSF